MASKDSGRSRGPVGQAADGVEQMIAGFVLGVLLFFGAFFVLVWGESRLC